MSATGLLYVGAVLFVNGLSLLGAVRGTSMIPMNLFVGVLQIITPLYLIFPAHGNEGVIVGASGLFLFAFTYLYVAMNNAFHLDGTGLGWFCLFVAVTAGVYAFWNYANYSGINSGRDVGYLLGCLWTNWAFLWLLFWIVLGIGKTGYSKYTGAVCASQGVYTGLVPALILLNFSSAITVGLAIGIGAFALVSDVVLALLLKPSWRIAPPADPAYSPLRDAV